MAGLTKADILKPKTIKTIKHPMPEWGKGAYVSIKALSSRDLVALQKKFGVGVEEENGFEFAVSLLSCCLVDDDGKNLFDNEDDVQQLLVHTPKVIEELGQVCMEISGIDTKKN